LSRAAKRLRFESLSPLITINSALIRRLELRDVEEVRHLLKVCWLDTYKGLLAENVIKAAIEEWQSKESIIRAVQNPRTYYAGYLEQSRVVGMISVGMIDADTAKVFQLYVLPTHQRRGIGSKLLDAAIGQFRGAKRVVLEVEEANRKGITFYEKYGFRYPSKTVAKVGEEEIPCLVGELNLVANDRLT
jgi:ribosomal protein S18 acetylase RimI-like enzyme